PSGKAPARRRAAPRRADWPCWGPCSSAPPSLGRRFGKRFGKRFGRRFGERALEPRQRERRMRGGRALVLPAFALGTGARPGLRLLADGEDAVADRTAARNAEVHQSTRRLARHNVVMAGLAADHAAERNDAVIGRLALRGGVEHER